MLVYNVITAICFALLTLCVAYAVVSFAVKNRADRIAFIRGFKNGKCIAVLLIAFPLLLIGHLYPEGADPLSGVLSSIAHVIDFVVLKFNIDKVGSLINANLFYRITIYYCCVLVFLNAVLFAFSFIARQVWQGAHAIAGFFSGKTKLYVFGNNENSISVYRSAGKQYTACLVDNVSGKEEGVELYQKKVYYLSRKNYEGMLARIVKSAQKKSYTIVVNTEDDEKNLAICNSVVKKAQALEADKRDGLFKNLRVYAFGDPRYEAVYNDVVSASFGCIRYRNKYRMLAMDFIDKYPLTKFMDGRQIDYFTSFVRPEAEINVCMIGFGKPNRQIFLTSVANNQFLTETEEGVKLKQVNYHLFDKGTAENDKNLNHLYYRFRNEYDKLNKEDYLPLPALPAKEKFHRVDVNSPDFYGELRAVVTRSEKDVNFVIVSFESDLENIDMAQKLVEKRREWGAEKNLVIFVRVRTDHSGFALFREERVYAIGNESECVYTVENITADNIYRMAQMRNEIYDLEYAITTDKTFALNGKTIAENRENADRNWYTGKCPLERESSLYCCLSLQSKLNLMGLEYCRKDEGDAPAMSEEDYIEYYAGDDLPDTTAYKDTLDGKKIVKYTLSFPPSKRKNLAVLEHYRWNSFMVSKGVMPATKEQILRDQTLKNGKSKYTNGKDYRLRRHGNVTTFAGLETFRKMVAERDGCSELDCDVIKYDYQLLDDAYWLLTKNGYKIVRRADAPTIEELKEKRKQAAGANRTQAGEEA